MKVCGADVGKGVGSEKVEEPMTIPELSTDIGVPEIVTAGPFGVRVLPAIATALEPAVKVWPFRVNV